MEEHLCLEVMYGELNGKEGGSKWRDGERERIDGGLNE